MNTSRRSFLKQSLVAAAGVALGDLAMHAAPSLPEPSARRLPQWKGFNLLEKFWHQEAAPFREADFALMAEWGFNFARLPMSYWCWSKPVPGEWRHMDERVLAEIDDAVELGRRHGIHVNLNLHRAPGYCVNPPAEPLSLWRDEAALEACCHHWAALARRYKGRPNRELSFDLLNEPPEIDEAAYVRVARALVAAIRAEDPGRLIIADGLVYGRVPVHGLADLGVAQSTRGYDPFHLSHWQASWIAGSDRWAAPTWPQVDESGQWDRARLRRERIEPWQKLAAAGVGVHVGEWGAYNRTPHDVVLAWMADQLALWREAGWGWALWNLRGTFGVLDSNRADVKYETFRGHQLDRRMLELLRADLAG